MSFMGTPGGTKGAKPAEGANNEDDAAEYVAASTSAAAAEPVEPSGKKKRGRYLNKVKRSRSPHAFNLYCNDYRDFLKNSNADISFGEMGKVLAGAWRVLAEGCREVRNCILVRILHIYLFSRHVLLCVICWYLICRNMSKWLRI